jgi:beta-N-acetylhexosaminidase
MSGTLATLLAMLVLGGGGGPAGDPHGGSQPALRGLGDAQLVGQRIVAGFSGRTPPNSLRRRIRGGRLAGVILFADNFGSRAGAERLARELQAIPRPRGLRDPLLVMIDQEGGLVKRLPGPPDLSAEQMGAAGRDTCRRQGAATGRLLRDTAINVDLAPVLDLATPGGAIAREQRSFGSDPRQVSSCAGAFAAALQRSGVAPTAKHFPGLGRARINTDDALQRIDASRAKLRRTDEVPFREFIGDGARGRVVMLSSAIYEAFAGRPAAFTAKLATRELRGRLGFEGVSITDALETASTQSFGGPTRAARFAARAGTDLMLFAELDSAKRAANALRGVLRRDRGRFAASVRRVLQLRSGLPG